MTGYAELWHLFLAYGVWAAADDTATVLQGGVGDGGSEERLRAMGRSLKSRKKKMQWKKELAKNDLGRTCQRSNQQYVSC